MKNTNILLLCFLLIIILSIYLFNINTRQDNFTVYTYDKDCDSFNDINSSIKIANRENECEYYGCKWITEAADKGKCVSKIFEGCALKTTKLECIKPITNFDKGLNKNRCKWVNSEGDKGVCIDSNIPTPCSTYNLDDCPTDNRYDVLGNFIEPSHCYENENKKECTTYYDHPKVKAITDIDGCNFYELDGNKGKKTDANCTKISFDKGATKWVHPDRLSCLNLDKGTCNGECEWDESGGGFCKTHNLELTNTFSKIIDKKEDYKFNITKQKLKEITSYTDTNKDKFIKDTTPIEGYGQIGNTFDEAMASSIKKILLTDCSKEINKLTLGDSIVIYTPNKEIYGKISSINELEKEILVEYPWIKNRLNDVIFSIDSSILWKVNNPTLGLFSSYQFSNALIDAVNLKKKYK